MIGIGGIHGRTKKRKKLVRQFGGSIGPSQYPKFVNPLTGKESMLPRPVVKSRPGKIGHLILSNNGWLNDLIKDIEF